MSLEREESIRRFRVLEIVDLTMKVNSIEGTDAPKAFTRLFGHTDEIDVCVYESGWKVGENPTWRRIVYLDQPGEMEKLEEIADYLIKTLSLKEKNS